MAIVRVGENKNLILDTITYSLDRAAYARFTYLSRYDEAESNLPFKPGDDIVILKDNHTLFNGYIIHLNRKASGDSGEILEYEAVGPRYFLNQLTALYRNTPVFKFNQDTKTYTSGSIIQKVLASFPQNIINTSTIYGISSLTYKPLDISYSGSTYEQVIEDMLSYNGPFRWYVDNFRKIHIVNLNNVAGYDVYIGQLGEKVSDHPEYDVIDHEFQYSLVGRFSRVRIFPYSNQSGAGNSYYNLNEDDNNGRTYYTNFHCRPGWTRSFFESTTKMISIPLQSSFDFTNVISTVNSFLNDYEFKYWSFMLPLKPHKVVGDVRLEVWKKIITTSIASIPEHGDPEDVLKPWVVSFGFKKIYLSPPSLPTIIPSLPKWAKFGAFMRFSTEPIYNISFMGFHYGDYIKDSQGNPTSKTFTITYMDMWGNKKRSTFKSDRVIYLTFKIWAPDINLHFKSKIISSKKQLPDKSEQSSNDESNGVASDAIHPDGNIITKGPSGTSYSWYNWNYQKDLVFNKTSRINSLQSDANEFANKELDKLKNVIISGRIKLKGIKTDLTLSHGINIYNSNLSQWKTIKANIYSITYNFREETTTVEFSNEYS